MKKYGFFLLRIYEPLSVDIIYENVLMQISNTNKKSITKNQHAST